MAEIVSKSQFAEREIVSPSMVSKWLAKGMPERRDGTLDADACAEWLAQHVRRNLPALAEQQGDPEWMIGMTMVIASLASSRFTKSRQAAREFGVNVGLELWHWLDRANGVKSLADSKRIDRLMNCIIWREEFPETIEPTSSEEA